jgi:hypothetical protein
MIEEFQHISLAFFGESWSSSANTRRTSSPPRRCKFKPLKTIHGGVTVS